MPSWGADQQHLARIREAQATLEAKAAAGGGAEPTAPAPKPPDKAQSHCTGPTGRTLQTAAGGIQGCNAQAAAVADQQVIVAPGLNAQGSDQHQLAPMIAALKTTAGRLPAELSADAGSCNERNLQTLEDRAIRGSRATGRRTACARLWRAACGRGAGAAGTGCARSPACIARNLHKLAAAQA